MVTLRLDQVLSAAIAGALRQTENLKRGRKDAYGARADRAWQMHIEGALAECAVASALNIFWDGKGLFRGDDVRQLQVRSTRVRNGSLIVHHQDGDDEIFVLVINMDDRRFSIEGWAFGREAKLPAFFKEPHKGRPAYFMPISALRPMSSLLAALGY